MTILSKNAIFRPKTELEAIARWSVDASREVDCAYFGNIGRNSGYFLLPIFLGSYLSVHPPTLLRSSRSLEKKSYLKLQSMADTTERVRDRA